VLRELEFPIEIDPHFPTGRVATKADTAGRLRMTIGNSPRALGRARRLWRNRGRFVR